MTDIVDGQTAGGEEVVDCCVEAAVPAKAATAAPLVREREGDGENKHRDDDVSAEANISDGKVRRLLSPLTKAT